MRDFLRRWKRYFVFAALLSCFINILQLTFAFYMFAIYRSIVASYNELSLYTITIIALYALVCLVFFNYLRNRLLSTAGVDLNQRIGKTVFRNVIKGMSGPAGRNYPQGLNDLETLRNYFNNSGLYALFDAPWAPLYLVLIYFFHPVLGMVATLGAGVIFGLSILQDVLTRKRLAEANSRYNWNRRLVDIMLRNAEAINSMGMQSHIARRWHQENDAVLSNQTIASRYAGTLQSLTRPMQVLMQVLMYGLGAYYAMLGQIDVGLMVAASIIMGQAVAPIMRAMAAWRFTLQASESFQRLRQFLDVIEKKSEKMTLPKPAGKIEAQQLFLKIGEHFLIRNVSFDLQPGEHLGVIGPSGAGKSTLCRIILGLWPSIGGKIRLDSVDLFYWDQEELGQHLGYLAQEVELFDAPIAQNIARMGTVNMERVKQAADAAGLDKWISALDDGYHTILGASKGIRVSGGQKQRIGLARAIYGEPSVLVLDEPNSNLDIEGTAALQQLLRNMKKQRKTTCVVVTHSPEILDTMDKLLVLREGRVVQFGPKNHVFKGLMKAQQAFSRAG